MDYNMIKIGQQMTQVSVVQYYVYNKFFYSSDEIAECLSCTKAEIDDYIMWIKKFDKKLLYENFISDELKIRDSLLYSLIYYVLTRYGNMYLRDICRCSSLPWGKIASKINELYDDQNNKYDWTYFKNIFEQLYDYRSKLIEKCEEKYHDLVVKQITFLDIDFTNLFEVGYLCGYLEVIKSNCDQTSYSDLEKNISADELAIIFPDKEFQKEINATKSQLIKILKSENAYEENKQYVTDILVGIAILNNTGVEELAKFLTVE